MTTSIEHYDLRTHILVKGAKVNNLKSLDVAIPRNRLIVVTGVSGSGKSSLAFDTLFAEGQRMYVESLSAYARQFLGRMQKPEVEYIRGICPAIAVEQKVNTRNPRSTVGTTTEIYDYLKLIFARIGETFSPKSGQKVRKDSVTDVVDFVCRFPEGTRFIISYPLKIRAEQSRQQTLDLLLQKGFTRLRIGEKIRLIEEIGAENITAEEPLSVLVDRDVVKYDVEKKQRVADSVQTAFFESTGDCEIVVFPEGKAAVSHSFSDRFEADGMQFEEPEVNFFSFNNPHGACKRCEGFGSVRDIDPDLVIPNKNYSIYEGAIMPWRTPGMSRWVKELIDNAHKFDFPVHRAYKDLSEAEQKLLWAGNDYFRGIDNFFADLAAKKHKIQYRVMLSHYMGRRVCPDCRGSRLRKDAAYVKIAEKSITDLVLMPIGEALAFFNTLKISAFQKKVAHRIIPEIRNRLHYLCQVGLEYLTLNRLTSTLSGGEYQRIKLATSLGSALVGSMYILDEPSIGLHPRDTDKLIGVLQKLRNLGNTVIVVEHEEDIMRAADQIIDIGPEAGSGGGELVFQGNIDQLARAKNSRTADYLHGKTKIELPKTRRKSAREIVIENVCQNNLKNIDVRFPLQTLTVVTGVSGSGKSSLVRNVLYPAISKKLGKPIKEIGKYGKISGDLNTISGVEMVDQNPIGKSSRSNPVTYVKAYDLIRALFAEQTRAKQQGYKPGHFSFNIEGGRCEMCQGEGKTKIEMQFMADIYLTCEHCNGKRFKDEVLQVTYKHKNISDVLGLSIDEAIDFFAEVPKITEKLRPLQETGLGYIRLGQSSDTLSGGEAQRVKLAYFLVKGNLRQNEKILFIFDEPTTGLHFQDIQKLLVSLNALIEKGHSVVVIEHNMEVIKSADWVIDLGPEGGEKGGNVCFAGTPEAMIGLENNHTASYLKKKLAAETEKH